MELVLIAAFSPDRVIGKDGKLPWRIPEDMRRFKELTMGYPVIMGRKTWDSISERYRPLEGRTNVVLTRNSSLSFPRGVLTADSLDDAISKVGAFSKGYVIGGQSLYEEAIGRSNILEITEVAGKYEGDAYFPKIDSRVWKEINRVSKSNDNNSFSFVTYVRQNH